MKMQDCILALSNALRSFGFAEKYFIKPGEGGTGKNARFAIASKAEHGGINIHSSYHTYDEMNAYLLGYHHAETGKLEKANQEQPNKPVIGVYMYQGTVQWTAANVPGITVVLMDEDKESEDAASVSIQEPDPIPTGKLSTMFAEADPRFTESGSDKEVRMSFQEQLLANNL